MSPKNALPVYSGNSLSAPGTRNLKQLSSARSIFIVIGIIFLVLCPYVFPERSILNRLSKGFPGQTASSSSRIHLVKARHGAVASGDKQCSKIGVDILKHGGNAVDAAVSTVLCIGVVNMYL
jgi:hypothetical protein